MPSVIPRIVAWHDSFPPSPLWLLLGICSQCARLGFDCCLCLLACYFSRGWSQTLTGDGVLCVGRYVSMSVGSASTSASFALAFECSVRYSMLVGASALGMPSAISIRSQTLTGDGVLCGCRATGRSEFVVQCWRNSFSFGALFYFSFNACII